MVALQLLDFSDLTIWTKFWKYFYFFVPGAQSNKDNKTLTGSDIINEFFQLVAIGAQHHPAGDYDISLNDSVGDKNLYLLWLMILLFLLTYHLSVLRKLPAQASYHLDF